MDFDEVNGVEWPVYLKSQADASASNEKSSTLDWEAVSSKALELKGSLEYFAVASKAWKVPFTWPTAKKELEAFLSAWDAAIWQCTDTQQSFLRLRNENKQDTTAAKTKPFSRISLARSSLGSTG